MSIGEKTHVLKFECFNTTGTLCTSILKFEILAKNPYILHILKKNPYTFLPNIRSQPKVKRRF